VKAFQVKHEGVWIETPKGFCGGVDVEKHSAG
jgi:hypothetical protein